MKQLVESYTFDPIGKTVTLLGIPLINLENLLLITNVTDNVMIYSFADPSLGASVVTNNMVTLDYNTSSMSSADRLQIFVDVVMDPRDILPTPIMPSVSGQQSLNQAMPVAMANEQFFDYQAPNVSLLNPVVGTLLAMQDCLQYRSVAIQITNSSTISGGYLIFEGSNELDASNSWCPVTLLDISSSAGTVASSIQIGVTGTDRYFKGPIDFRYFRIRITNSVVGGAVSVSVMYRMTPTTPVSNVPVNVFQYAGQGAIIAGVGGLPAVGGQAAPGATPAGYPITVGGVDYGGLVRRTISDSQGHTTIVGVDPSRVGNSNPIITRDADGSEGRKSSSELLELILQELKLANYYLKEMPLMLSTPNGQFIDELKDFINISDKI